MTNVRRYETNLTTWIEVADDGTAEIKIFLGDFELWDGRVEELTPAQVESDEMWLLDAVERREGGRFITVRLP